MDIDVIFKSYPVSKTIRKIYNLSILYYSHLFDKTENLALIKARNFAIILTPSVVLL